MTFRPRVQDDLDSAGCTAGSCHASDAVPMRLVADPITEDDWRNNYNQVRARAGTVTSSLLLDKAQGAGGHLAGLAADDPIVIRWQTWIAAGAPFESTVADPDGGAGASADAGLAADAGTAAGLTWRADVDPIMRARCTRCHGTEGAYSLESYSAAFGFGRDATPNIVPGDPTSLLAQYAEQGHEGIPAAEALIVVEWIVDWNAAE
jgi:hypothetical protein